MVLQFTRSFLEQISRLRENLLPGNYEGSAIYEQKELRSSGKHRRCAFANEWRDELLEYYAWISRTRQYCFREKCFSTTPYTLNPNC